MTTKIIPWKTWIAVLFLLFYASASWAGGQKYERSVESYTVPDVTLVNQNGERVRIKSVIESSEIPVRNNFV